MPSRPIAATCAPGGLIARHDTTRRRPLRSLTRIAAGAVAAGATLAAMVAPAAAQLDVADNVAYDNADLGAGTIQPNDNLGAAMGHGDFDADGYGDIVVGIPGDGTVGGSIRSIPGSPDGPVPDASTFVSQNTLFGDDGGEGEQGDRFGHAVAVGDFNADGFDDVAVGVPYEDHSDRIDAGAVNVVYGSPAGLTAAGFGSFSEANVFGVPGDEDWFGWALAVGDFDADGYDDLAIGKPGEDIVRRNASAAGAVNVVYGSPTGLTERRGQIFNQLGPVAGVPQEGDAFGRSLAAGDFDGDGDDDLAVGVPFEDVRRGADAGKVNIIGGGSTGLDVAGNFLLSQRDTPGLPEAGDWFGRSLVAADLDGDDIDDLAIGVPGEGLRGRDGTGAVNVIYGTNRSLAAGASQLFSQAGPVPGLLEADDQFGWALAAGDTDLDGIDDLVVGIPGESLGAADEAGGLIVFGSGSTGVTVAGAEYYNRRRPIFGLPQGGDRWGDAVAVGDTNGDDGPDLVVGVPFEDKGSVADAGQVHVIFNSR
jgi:hypothetical protein